MEWNTHDNPLVCVCVCGWYWKNWFFYFYGCDNIECLDNGQSGNEIRIPRTPLLSCSTYSVHTSAFPCEKHTNGLETCRFKAIFIQCVINRPSNYSEVLNSSFSESNSIHIHRHTSEPSVSPIVVLLFNANDSFFYEKWNRKQPDEFLKNHETAYVFAIGRNIFRVKLEFIEKQILEKALFAVVETVYSKSFSCVCVCVCLLVHHLINILF